MACATQPELLPHLEFTKYEAVYKQRRAGELDTARVTATYGKDVLDLMGVQFAVEQDDSDDREVTDVPEVGVRALLTSAGPRPPGPGAERPRFGLP